MGILTVPARSSPPRGRLLVVDDDEALLRSFGRLLVADGYEVDLRADGETALEAVRQTAYDAVVSDIDLPRLNGLAMLQRIRAHGLDLPVVLVTGAPALDTALAAIDLGALRYVSKPVDGARLRAVVADAVRRHRLARAKQQALELVEREHLAAGRAELASGLDGALASLWIAYQPIVSWARRGVFGYEALVRSRAPTFPHPGALLDAAERLDRVDELGRAIREKAVEPLAGMPAGAMLFVNLHPRDLLDEQLFDERSPLARIAQRVVLEVTERASLNHVRDVGARIGRLRHMGFRIAVDDLGAGYAGLTSFAQLEPEIVKLDMSLVRGVHGQPTKLTLVRTMITMCHELGMQVVAEGIETPDERDAIVDAGCDLLQGYLFARPGEAFPPVML